jgi:long-chain acyl-CoA synthetase
MTVCVCQTRLVVSNLADLIRDSAAEYPEAVAIVDGERQITYARLDANVTALARKLAKNGLEPGDRVGIIVGNTYEFVVSFFASLRAGAVAVPVGAGSALDEIEVVVEATQPRFLISDRASAAALDDIGVDDHRILVTRSIRWKKWILGSRNAEFASETNPDSTAVLMFSAGNSGRSRAVMLSHRAILANVEALLHLGQPEAILRTDTSLVALPLSHVYSLSTVLTLSLAAGATVVLSEGSSPREQLKTIADHKVTVVTGAPSLYLAWSQEEGVRHAFAGTRLVRSGAAPLEPALFEHFRTLTGKSIWEGYGLTECSPVVASTLVTGSPKAGSVGRPLPNVQVKIVPEREERPGVSIDGLDEANEREPGEIWVRGPSVFSGYWPDGSGGPDEHGWFGTGDVGYMDADGDLTLVDRRSEMLIVSGFNVYPREVERVIGQNSSVAECAVFGVPHESGGDAVKAVVALRPGYALTTEELVEFCEEHLARFKCPTIVNFVGELPHSATGKVARRRLRWM